MIVGDDLVRGSSSDNVDIGKFFHSLTFGASIFTNSEEERLEETNESEYNLHAILRSLSLFLVRDFVPVVPNSGLNFLDSTTCSVRQEFEVYILHFSFVIRCKVFFAHWPGRKGVF